MIVDFEVDFTSPAREPLTPDDIENVVEDNLPAAGVSSYVYDRDSVQVEGIDMSTTCTA